MVANKEKTYEEGKPKTQETSRSCIMILKVLLVNLSSH